MKTKLCVAFVLMMPLLFAEARAQTPDDTHAIKQTALDYIEGWYEGNAERMEPSCGPRRPIESTRPVPGRACETRTTLELMLRTTLQPQPRRNDGCRPNPQMTPYRPAMRRRITFSEIFANRTMCHL